MTRREMKHGLRRRPYRRNEKVRGEIIGAQYQNRDKTAKSVIRTVHKIPVPYAMDVNSARVNLTIGQCHTDDYQVFRFGQRHTPFAEIMKSCSAQLERTRRQ